MNLDESDGEEEEEEVHKPTKKRGARLTSHPTSKAPILLIRIIFQMSKPEKPRKLL